MATPNPYSKVLYGTSACLSGSSCILSSICLVSGFSCVAPLPALSGVLGNLAGYAGQVSSAVADHLATKRAAKATVDIVSKLIQ